MKLKFKRAGLVSLAAFAATVGLSALAPPASAAGDEGVAARSDRYIVQMADQPVAAYKGGVRGYASTKPNRGSKIDRTRRR